MSKIEEALEFITNTFYAPTEKYIKVEIGEGNYYDRDKIVLDYSLMSRFAANNLPVLVVFYHEVLHKDLSEAIFNLESNWSRVKSGPIAYKEKYHHLLNWVEDFYIEKKGLEKYPYLEDILHCIRRLPPEYNINEIQYAFNYYYQKNKPSPALKDPGMFMYYINELYKLRDGARFGKGPLLKLGSNTESQYANMIIAFYNFCVNEGIFAPDAVLPTLNNPNNFIVSVPATGTATATTTAVPATASTTVPVTATTVPALASDTGSYTDDGTVEVYYVEKTPQGGDALKVELDIEQEIFDRFDFDSSQTFQTERSTMEGYFNSKKELTTIIQGTVEVQNFFNPNKLIDGFLFTRPSKTFLNVAVFRDVSGSVSTLEHKMMDLCVKKIIEEVPSEIDYYLYSSNLYKTEYVEWAKLRETPKEYSEIMSHLGASTNSNLIADEISAQLDDKYLNIIITDGDLDRLMARDNIAGLLNNVYIIYIGKEEKFKDMKYIKITEESEIENLWKGFK